MTASNAEPMTYSEKENSRENRRAALYAATTLYQGQMTTESIIPAAEAFYAWLEKIDDTQRC